MKSRLIELRRNLAGRLARQIRNPGVEAKELQAFDLIVGRRLFLKGAGLGALAALVNSSLPPTAWAKASHNRHSIKPRDVGLTRAEMATVTQASGIDFGTELFQDTIYAQPVVAPTQINKHCLIEAARSRMRVQSQIDDQTPLEETFFDSGFHFGPSELIQLEQDSKGVWQLVHYFHPWTARTDGARTDGLIRYVISSFPLVTPTRIFCITGSHTNEFITTAQGQQVAASYLVYVEMNNGKSDGYIAIGHALSSVASGEVTDAPAYPLTWDVMDTADLDLPPGTSDYRFADKYVNAGLDLAVPGDYAPAQATEHIVIYLKNRIKIISLDDITTPGKPILIVTAVPFPNGVTDIPRIAHIEFNPVPGATGAFLQLSDYALLSTESTEGNADTNYCYSNQSRNATINSGGYKNFGSGGLKWLDVAYANSDYGFTARRHVTDDDRPDITTLQNVNGLASTGVDWPDTQFTQTMHLKIGSYPGASGTSNRGLSQFAISRQVGDDDGNDPDLVLYAYEGDFPLAVPDDAGIGTVTGISGGSSKFGGLRLFASDDIGNLFMLRQQRLAGSSTPYSPPIYIQNDAEGEPATFSSTGLMPVPSATAAASNLQGFTEWMTYFYSGNSLSDLDPNQVVAYNFLLSGALGFGTSDANLAQATWLGSGAQAVYAPKRFAHDAEHMVVREVSDDGTTVQYNVYNVFNNIVEKTWVSRKIASQAAAETQGVRESGDFYQALVYATNLYGDQVALNDATNPNMMIEVRGDAPATVIDLTNNNYYDVDRYTSFVALPDSASNQLRLAVKAENFSQILYVRLLQTDALSPSASDSAMLSADTAAVGAATDWVAINIAADGQARMAASSSTTAATPSGSCGACGDQEYVCGQSLCQSNADNNWQTKGGYEPNTGNLDSLSSYLNQSGQNLADASSNSANFGLGTTSVDPLTSTTSLTANANRTALKTTFDYKGGTISVAPVSTQAAALPGDVFSSVSNALHDALHWLQHVEGKLYSSLSNGVDVVIDDTENISVTVAADIMKQVNGIDQDLNEVVSTVEEYGSIVVNVVVTVVESTFIYKFIELLIALISLFIYLEDIKQLSSSLKSLIKGLPNPASSISLPPLDANYPWEDKLTGYVGSPNNIDSEMSQGNTDSVVDEVVDGLLNTVLKNPLTKKILDEVVSALSRAIKALDTSSPVKFSMDSTIVDSQIQLLEDFSNDVDSLYVDVTDDAVNFLINEVVDDVENPQQTYTNLASGLDQFMGQVETDTMNTVYTALGQLVATDTNLIDEMMSQSGFLELDIALLADLFQLFGIGSGSGNKVTVGSGDAICFPMALVIWVAIFEATGKSINNINDLISDSTTLPGGLAPGANAADKLAYVNAIVAADMATVNGIVWTAMQTVDSEVRVTQPYKSLNIAGDLALLIRWGMALTTSAIQYAHSDLTEPFAPTFSFSRLVMAITSLVTKLTSSNISPLSILSLNSFLNLVAITDSIAEPIANGTSLTPEQWAVLVGNDVGRAGTFGKLGYTKLYGSDYKAGLDFLPYVSLFVVGTAAGGFGAAAVATGVEKNVGATAPTGGCLQPPRHVINQLIDQIDALNIRLPKRAQRKLQARATRFLEQARRAYARGDKRDGAAYLGRFARTVRSLKQSRRIRAADARLLLTQVRGLRACQR